jgi:hypothetical protein
MRRLLVAIAVSALAMVALAPSATGAAHKASSTFQLHIGVPNVSQAPNGDRVAVTGEGEFGVHAKTVEAEGSFTHTSSTGTVLVTGTWTATALLSFHFYGCGAVPALDLTLPPDFCGGALKMAVTLTPTGTTLGVPGILTVFCVIGPKAPTPHDNPAEPGEEGIHLVVPGIANFNEIVSGMNVYIRTS